MLAEAESMGIDTESIREDAARATQEESEDAYHQAVQDAIRQAIAGARQSAAGSDTGAASGGRQDNGKTPGDQSPAESKSEAVDAPALDLEAQTPADLKAKADREEAATKAERAKKAAEQERLRKEAEARDLKARADQTVDDLQLGQDADQQMSGMGSLFDEPTDAPTPAPAISPQPGEIPANVKSRLKAALEYLQGIREEVDRVKKVGGSQDVRVTWEKYATQVANTEERVDQMEAKAKELGVDIAPAVAELGGRPTFDDVRSATANHPDAAQPDSYGEEPTFTEAQARKQIEWRDLGQKDGTKTHAMFFYTRPADKGTGRAMGYGNVQLFQRSSGWKVDGEGNTIPSLADAKKAAIDAAIPKLREQGWISAANESTARTNIDASNTNEGRGRPEELIALRKRQSILKSLMECLQS
jgi:hypothetical protein